MRTVLGGKIRDHRKAKKMTLDQLAELAGASKSYIWELENRPVVRPSAEKLTKIAAALELTVEFLLDDEREEPDDSDEDQAFFRKFGKLDAERKAQLKKILDALEDD